MNLGTRARTFTSGGGSSRNGTPWNEYYVIVFRMQFFMPRVPSQHVSYCSELVESVKVAEGVLEKSAGGIKVKMPFSFSKNSERVDELDRIPHAHRASFAWGNASEDQEQEEGGL